MASLKMKKYSTNGQCLQGAGNKCMWMSTDNTLIILNLPFLVIWYSVTIFSDYYVASEVILDTHVF